MSYKATWNGQVLAEASEDDVLHIEGNVYFAPSTVNKEFFKDSDAHSTCYWKGLASYYDIDVDGEFNEGAAWYYPEPKEGSPGEVAKSNNGKGDFANYVAFWKGVEVTQE